MSKLSLQIIGHLGNDATIENVNGNQVIKFSVAHSEKFKNAQGVQVDKTTWVRCNYWNDKTTIAQWLKKGGLVEVTGQPTANAYADASGQPKASLDIRVTGISLLGSSPQKESTEGGNKFADVADGSFTANRPQQSTQSTDKQDTPIDNLPF